MKILVALPLFAGSLLLTGCLSDRIPNRTLEERVSDARRVRPEAGSRSESVAVSTPDFERYRAATGVEAAMFLPGRAVSADSSLFVIARIREADASVSRVEVLAKGHVRPRRGDNGLVVNLPTEAAPCYVFASTVVDWSAPRATLSPLSTGRFGPGVTLAAQTRGEGLVLPAGVSERVFIDGYQQGGRVVNIECLLIDPSETKSVPEALESATAELATMSMAR